MKKISNVVLIIAALIGGFYLYYVYTSQSGIKKNVKNALIVGTNASFPPFEYIVDGNLEGFEIELMKEISAYLNKEIIFKDMAFESLLLEAQSGRVNVLAAALTPTPERSKHVFFTKPYLENDSLVVITKADKSPRGLDDLNNKEVVVNDGYTAESFMEKQEGVNLLRLETPAEAFMALLNGRCYAYVSARSAVQPFFDRYGSEQFNILTLPVSDSYALAVPKAFPEIFQQVNHALDVLQKNGTLRRLKNKWHLDF